jgi:hypothetical protein
MMEGWEGDTGAMLNGARHLIEYKQDGFKTASDAAAHLSNMLDKYADFTISDSVVSRAAMNNWQATFSGYKYT